MERRLRARVGELVATQAVEDEAGRRGCAAAWRDRGCITAITPAKRIIGGKSRARMTLAELEAAIGWLERNRSLSICTYSRATPVMPGRPASAGMENRRSAA